LQARRAVAIGIDHPHLAFGEREFLALSPEVDAPDNGACDLFEHGMAVVRHAERWCQRQLGAGLLEQGRGHAGVCLCRHPRYPDIPATGARFAPVGGAAQDAASGSAS
jgi:hypothetical protein